jgi:3-oxoacyl-[acyl-carrier-protein] synthase II
MDPFMHYGIAAGVRAVNDAGIDFVSDRDRCAVIAGAGIGNLGTIEEHNVLAGGRVGSRRSAGLVINGIGDLSFLHSLRRPNLGVVTAHYHHALGLSARAINMAMRMLRSLVARRWRHTDRCGGSPGQALSSRNDSPATASRPGSRRWLRAG